LFAFAGIWDRWRNPSGNNVETCSILTTTSNAVTSAVHDRMPVILDPDNYDLWLDPGMQNVAAASESLKPYDAELSPCHPVNTRINRVANDDEECSAPVERVHIQNVSCCCCACLLHACLLLFTARCQGAFGFDQFAIDQDWFR